MISRTSFTLIELVAALLLVALVATVAVMSFASTRSVAEMNDVLEQIGHQDQLLRAYCKAHDRSGQLFVDLSHGRIVRTDAKHPKAEQHPYELPAGFQIEQAWTGDHGEEGQRHRAISGKVTVPCSTHGYTPTYALELSDKNNKRQWLLVTGLTGECIEGLDEKQLEAIVAPMSGSRHDID